jgi:hypothetical protein
MIGIIGLLTDVFIVAAAEAGRSFEAPRRGTSTSCPFCSADELSFSIRDSLERWKCFRASCDLKGGALDVPIAFGLADGEKSAAKWLVEHGFLHRRERTPGKAYSIGRVERPQVDTSTLSPERAALRAEALRVLAEFVPAPALRLARNYIADRRAVRERERLREQRALVQLAIIDQIAGENHRGAWGATKDDVDEARRRAPLAFA